MKEILLTSSVLILALLLFAAAVPKNHLPPGAVRPVGAGGAAAAGAGQPARHGAQCPDGGGAGNGPDHRPGPVCDPLPGNHCLRPAGRLPTPPPYQPFRVDTATEDSTVTFTDGKNVTHSIEYKSQIPLTPVPESRLAHRDDRHGGVVPACEPPLHAARLRRSRTPYPVESCPYPVYLTAELPSPPACSACFTPLST